MNESLCSPFYKRESRHREVKNDLPKVAQLVSDGAGIQTQAVWLQSPCS